MYIYLCINIFIYILNVKHTIVETWVLLRTRDSFLIRMSHAASHAASHAELHYSTHCNTYESFHTYEWVTRCNTRCNTLQHTLQHTRVHSHVRMSHTLQHTLQHAATHSATHTSPFTLTNDSHAYVPTHTFLCVTHWFMHHGFFFPLALFMCRLFLCIASLIHIPHFLFNHSFTYHTFFSIRSLLCAGSLSLHVTWLIHAPPILFHRTLSSVWNLSLEVTSLNLIPRLLFRSTLSYIRALSLYLTSFIRIPRVLFNLGSGIRSWSRIAAIHWRQCRLRRFFPHVFDTAGDTACLRWDGIGWYFYMYVCMCVYMYVYMYVNVYIYICI